jgi:hypothetical protein
LAINTVRNKERILEILSEIDSRVDVIFGYVGEDDVYQIIDL